MPTITIKGYKCTRCGHEWTPRNDTKPIICPHCKSAYWDTERKEKN